MPLDSDLRDVSGVVERLTDQKKKSDSGATERDLARKYKKSRFALVAASILGGGD